MAFFFIYVGIEVGFSGWIFTYATTLGLANETAAAYLTSAFWGALTVGRLFAIPLTARLRPSAILYMDLLGALASIGLMILCQSTTALWLGVIGLGLFFASVFPTTLSLADRRMSLTGKVTGWLFLGASLGGMTLPLLMGLFLENISPIAILWFTFLALILAGSLAAAHGAARQR